MCHLREEVLAGGIPFPPDTPEAILGTTTTEFLHTSMPSSWRFFGSSGLDRVISLYVCILNTSDSLDALLILWWASKSAAQQASITRSVIEDELTRSAVEVRASVQVWTTYTKLLFSFSKSAHISIWILPSLQLNCWISAALDSCRSSTDDEGVGARLKCVLLWSIVNIKTNSWIP